MKYIYLISLAITAWLIAIALTYKAEIKVTTIDLPPYEVRVITSVGSGVGDKL